MDLNVAILQSKQMAARLSAAGTKMRARDLGESRSPTEDSEARAQMLRKSDAFLRQAMGNVNSRRRCKPREMMRNLELSFSRRRRLARRVIRQPWCSVDVD